MRLVVALSLAAAVSIAAGAQKLPKNLAHELTQRPARAPSNPAGELFNPPANDAEDAAMKDLACVCGTCKREPIRTCTCDLAAKMRGEVKQQLAGVDVSTAAARKVAHDHVLAWFAQTYGADVLAPARVTSIDDRLGSLPIVVILGAGVTLMIWRTRRSLRRARQRERLPRNDDFVV
jgi:cytochrome c-type biogenesis protein CcmH/NrfF